MIMYCDICGTKIENGENINECPHCLCNISNEKSPIPSGSWVKAISTDESFINAMVELYEKDPIEYQLKIQQFKTQLQQQESSSSAQKSENSKKLTCPKCGSTNITDGTKGFSIITGFIGSGDFRYVCRDCRNKWKPDSLLELAQRANNKHW